MLYHNWINLCQPEVKTVLRLLDSVLSFTAYLLCCFWNISCPLCTSFALRHIPCFEILTLSDNNCKVKWQPRTKQNQLTFKNNQPRWLCCLLGSFQYAMAVKRDEIQRMEDIIKDEERKLQKAEYYLEEDATTFDELLKEKHKSSVQALKM